MYVIRDCTNMLNSFFGCPFRAKAVNRPSNLTHQPLILRSMRLNWFRISFKKSKSRTKPNCIVNNGKESKAEDFVLLLSTTFSHLNSAFDSFPYIVRGTKSFAERFVVRVIRIWLEIHPKPISIDTHIHILLRQTDTRQTHTHTHRNTDKWTNSAARLPSRVERSQLCVSVVIFYTNLPKT